MSNQEYLAHYGVLGMKWGHRRGERYAKTLNRLDQKAANETSKALKATAKSDHLTKKAMKMVDKKGGMANLTQKDKNRLNKMRSKVEASDLKSKEYMKKAHEIDAQTAGKVALARASLYIVDKKETFRNGERGRTALQTLLGGAVGNVTIDMVRYNKYYKGNLYDGQAPWAIRGNKYTVYR